MGNVMFSAEEEQAWKNSEIKQFPDGQYLGVLRDAKLIMKGLDRRKYICLSYEIETPQDYIGAIYKHHLLLDNSSIFWLIKQTISLFGIDTRDLRLADLEEAFAPHIGTRVTFTLVRDGKYQNAKLDGTHGKAEEQKTNSNEPPPFDQNDINF